MDFTDDSNRVGPPLTPSGQPPTSEGKEDSRFVGREAVIDDLLAVLETSEHVADSAGKASEPFWEQCARQLLQYALRSQVLPTETSALRRSRTKRSAQTARSKKNGGPER